MLALQRLLRSMSKWSCGTDVLQTRQKKALRNKQQLTWAAIFFIHASWNQLGLCRSSLDLCFINTIRLSTLAIYLVQLNGWKASNQHTSAKFKGGAQKYKYHDSYLRDTIEGAAAISPREDKNACNMYDNVDWRPSGLESQLTAMISRPQILAKTCRRDPKNIDLSALAGIS